jgi:acetyl-CoA acetyltransferase
MRDVFVAGVGMTPFGRCPDVSLKELARLALSQALQDASLPLPAIEAAFFANATQGHMEGQQMIRGEIVLRSIGIGGIPVFNIENACASGSSAFHLAWHHVRSGAAEVAVALGAEKMFSTDRARMFSVFDSAWDVHDNEEIRRRIAALGAGVEVPPGTTSERPYSVFMDVYAGFARAHMKAFGTTRRQIAAVAAKNHAHSVHNERAQYRHALSIDEVLAAPPITYPLTVPMCSPVSDGAAAIVLCSGEAVQRRGLAARAVRVRASVVQTGSDRVWEDYERHCTALAAGRAYEQAGVSPGDISLAEVHDATAVGEIIQTENLRLFEFGQGGAEAERGTTSLGGRIPVNPSGGLESKGHPIGATGLAQLFELVTQLRGEAQARQVPRARLAIAENGGGLQGIEEAVAAVTLLEAPAARRVAP